MDVFVTNDNAPNALFRNLGNGKFEEVGLLAGVALMDSGKPVASMGADFRDYDNDGWPDLFVVDLFNETFPVLRNTGKGGFRDAGYATRISRLTAKISGWGVGLFDFNLDGWKDLFYTCAHVNDLVEQFEPTRYRLPNTILINEKGVFRDGTAEAGADFQTPRAHRGLAFADFNGDGKMDAVVSSPSDSGRVVGEHHGDGRRLADCEVAGGPGEPRRHRGPAEMGRAVECHDDEHRVPSSGHFGVHFGAPKGEGGDTLEIWWPGGEKQVVTGVKPRQVLVVREAPSK